MNYRDWMVGTVLESRPQTSHARTIVFEVAGWTGSTAGQHVDIRLTAEDGYQTARAYSLASTGPGNRVELGVDLIPDGEVSPYLVHELRAGDQVELRGPLGRWFTWKPTITDPVQLVAGGSGIVPLLAIVRAHAAAASTAPVRLLYSVRSPDDLFYSEELMDAAAAGTLDLTIAYTRRTPPGHPTPAGRITAELVAATTIPPSAGPAIFVCGPNGFVAAAADHLIAAGHDPLTIKTERFGGD